VLSFTVVAVHVRVCM